jgi:uncharacterized membrane protein
MQIELEASLDRWTQAALLNSEQAARIREFESSREPRRGTRVPILMGVALGGIMLAAGVLLFVAAHWVELSLAQRLALAVFVVGGLHFAGAFCSHRFPALAVTLHAVGTAALGGAISLGGEVFHMQEHWLIGLFLWASGALLSWWLLRSWPQLAFAALLIPLWLIAEWADAVSSKIGSPPVVAIFCTSLAISYLSLRTSESPLSTRVFAWIGGINLIPTVVLLAVWDWRGNTRDEVTGMLAVVGWAGALLLPLALAAIYRKTRVWINVVASLWVLILSALSWHHSPISVYAWCAIGSAGMIGWGIQEFRAERVNLGMAGFAITIPCFYFSNVMDMMGRSTSLMVLGILFLAGAWYWEKLRRKLVAHVNAAALAGGAA